MNTLKNTVSTILGIVFSLGIIFTLLISSVEFVCYHDPEYFAREYEKYDVLSTLPEMTMSYDDGLMKVTEHMMDYLRGDEDELQVYVMMDGEERGFFTDREIAHMEDVRALFLGAVFLRRIAACMAFVIVAVLAIIKKSAWGVISCLSKGMLLGTAAAVIVCGALGAVIATDFSNAFITFHHIFFDNDLWILDPRVDMLVNIVPEGFFFDTAARILGLFLAGIIILCILSAIFLMRKKHMEVKK